MSKDPKVPSLKELNIYIGQLADNIGIQMKQNNLAKTFMMI